MKIKMIEVCFSIKLKEFHESIGHLAVRSI
jgi:hypothetical protein